MISPAIHKGTRIFAQASRASSLVSSLAAERIAVNLAKLPALLNVTPSAKIASPTVDVCPQRQKTALSQRPEKD